MTATVLEHMYGVLKNKDKSRRNGLNNSDHKFDLYGTPWNRSRYELKLELVLPLSLHKK